MRFLAVLFSMILGGAALAFAVSPAAHAGSCTEPITQVNWTAKVNSGVRVRSMTCMEEGVVLGTLSGGSTVQVIGDAHGWYQVKMSDGTTGFVWNSFLTVTDKSGNVVESIKTHDKKEVTKTVVKKEHKTVSKESNAQISDRLKGRILLQVEQNGEAWYVHPDDGKRFYMKDGDTAYDMMREFGLGITDADLAKLQSGDKALKEQLKGKIVLQVQQHGEAFYIHPETGETHYLKNGKEAYRIMRELSLGITDADLKKIDSDDFQAFKKKKEKLREAKKNIIEPSLNGKLALTAEAIDGKVFLNWSATNVDTSKGFKVVYSTFPNPTYPNHSPEYLSDGSKRSHAKRIKETGFYHFRICQYTGDGCGLYSNDVGLFVEVPVIDTSSSGEIALTADVVDGKVKLNWTVSGVDTSKGFKVVHSKDANPVYPHDSPEYLSDGSVRSHSKFLKEGTYHFRVCRYTGDGCDSYSNDVVVTIEGTNPAGTIPAGVDLGALNQYWLDQVNALRAEAGLRQLVLDSRWKATATEWAEYMGENNSGTHNRPDGKSMHQWIDTKGLDFTTRHSDGGWVSNYFTENISWGYTSSGTTEAVKKVLDDTMAFYLSEASYNGDHYRTIYHADWNSVGLGFHFTPSGNGYKVYVAMHYGSLNL